MMSQYGEGWPPSQFRGLPEKLLRKSATLAGGALGGPPVLCTGFQGHCRASGHSWLRGSCCYSRGVVACSEPMPSGHICLSKYIPCIPVWIVRREAMVGQ